MAEEKSKPKPKKREDKKELQPEVKQEQLEVESQPKTTRKKATATKYSSKTTKDDGSLKKGDTVKIPVGLCIVLSVEKDLVIVAKDNNSKVKYSIDINKVKKEK